MPPPDLLLALDTGSPLVSVAVGSRGEVLAERSIEIARSSARLLGLIAEVLCELAASPRDLSGALALAGPGSFTGLRVGLATVFGLHQALDLPARAVPTLPVLAASASVEGRAIAAVDALRGEWFIAQDGEIRLVSLRELAALEADARIGFGLPAALARSGLEAGLAREPGPLAPALLSWWGQRTLESAPETLLQPLYLRPPAVTPAAPAG